jgi:hypothetical protein
MRSQIAAPFATMLLDLDPANPAAVPDLSHEFSVGLRPLAVITSVLKPWIDRRCAKQVAGADEFVLNAVLHSRIG